MFSSALIGCRENAQKLTCHRQLPVSIFCVKIAVEGFSQLVGNFKEQAKTLNLFFS
jgi:hypothetical protein